MKFFIICALFFFTSICLPRDIKPIEVSLDKSEYKIIRAKMNAWGVYYIIDPQACICILAMYNNQDSSPTNIPCEKLSAYDELKDYVKNCKK